MLITNFNKLNLNGKTKLIEYSNDLVETPKYIEDGTILLPPKKEKQIWEKEGKEHLMPIACHDDNLTDKEKAIVNEKINEILKNLDKH